MVETLERAFRETSGTERLDVALDLAAAYVGQVRNDDAVALLLPLREREHDLDRERRLLVSGLLAAAAWDSPGFASVYVAVGDTLAADLPGETPGERLVLSQAGARMFDRCEPHAAVLDVLLRALGGEPAHGLVLGVGDLVDPVPLVIACGGLEEAERVSRARERHAHATGDDALYAAAQVWLARVALLRGELRAAEATTRLALGLPGVHDAVRSALEVQLGSICLAQGKPRGAAELLASAEAAPEGSVSRATTARRRGQIALAEGRPEQAVELLDEARTTLYRRGSVNPSESIFLTDLGLALVAVGRRPHGLALLRDMHGLAQKFGEPRPRGILEVALGRATAGVEALEHYERAVAILQETPYALDLARAELELGAALRRTNRRVAARERLRPALDYARRHGADDLARRAEEELRATGARPRRLVLTGVDSLTPSEARIARLVAGGRTNREIAQELFLTVKTIEMHLAGAFRKLDIGSRKELGDALREGPPVDVAAADAATVRQSAGIARRHVSS